MFVSVPRCCRAEQRLPLSSGSSARALLPLCPPHTPEPAGPPLLPSPSVRGCNGVEELQTKPPPPGTLGQRGAPTYTRGEGATAP